MVASCLMGVAIGSEEQKAMTQSRKKRVNAGQEPLPFQGFGPKALQFFHDLALHQDRAWFQEHQSIYEQEIQQPMAALVTALAEELSQRGLPLTGDPKRSMFRIHRDVRFSNDKTPYKTHAGAVLTRDGTKNCQGLLYIHISPEGSFTASGFYHPEPDQLLALRRAIAAAPGQFQQVERSLQKARLALGRDDALQTLAARLGRCSGRTHSRGPEAQVSGRAPRALRRLARPAAAREADCRLRRSSLATVDLRLVSSRSASSRLKTRIGRFDGSPRSSLRVGRMMPRCITFSATFTEVSASLSGVRLGVPAGDGLPGKLIVVRK